MIGAIDIGGSKTIVALVGSGGKVLNRVKFPSRIEDWRLHFDVCAESLKSLCAIHNLTAAALDGVGISLPGMVDGKKGTLLYAPFSKWKDVPAADWFLNSLKNTHVYVENDVNACALGELVYGHGRIYKDFLWITVSTGIGGAIVSDGRLITGAECVAGEFGHLKVEHEHPRCCPCGQSGCLEAHASGTAIGESFRIYLRSDPEALDRLKEQGLSEDAYGCRKMADSGDEAALEIFRQAGAYLGVGIAQAVNILNPKAVILGGGVGGAIDLLEQPIRQMLKKEAVSRAQDIQLLYTALGYDAALIGASALVSQQRLI